MKDEELDELKLCPFCGGSGFMYEGYTGYGVVCIRCGAETAEYIEKHEAVKKWNQRIDGKQL